jgi:hypothetical protein
MATRQITIDDGSKKRKQVELNLNPVALNPTVRAGGNYRVAVQQTPLTNSAMQLSNALKQGVSAYGQAVDVAQKKAAEDVANMSDAEYDKFLQKGLDPEARSLFGYTKTYNRQVAAKYYATEIPTKLQELSNDMFKNYYDYKDAASFEAALEERVGSVYDEADQLLGGNVFSEQANNALKSATRADFLSKEVAKFSRELPARNQQMAMESMARQFDGITSTNVDQIATIGGELINSHKGTLGGRAAAEAVFGTLQTKMNTLLASDSSVDHQLLEDMIEEIGDGKGEDNMVAGQELFATPTRQLYLTQMEKKLDKRKDESYNDAVRDAKVNLAGIQASAIRMQSEGKRKAYLDSAIKAMSIHGSVFNDVTYENDLLRDMMTVELNQMKANPLLFEREAAANFIARENSSQRSVDEYVYINLPESYTKKDMDNKAIGFTAAGQDFQEQYSLKRDTMYDTLYRSVIDIEDEGAQRSAFKEGEVELVKDLKEWVKETTNSSTAVAVEAKTKQQTEDIEEVGEKRVEELQSVMSPENAAKVIALEAEEARQDKTDKMTSENINGTLVPAGRSPQKRLENYQKLKKLGTLSDDEVYQAHVSIHADAWVNKEARIGFENKILLPSEADKLIMRIIPKWGYATGVNNFIKPPLEKRLENGTKLFELMQTAGVPAETLVDGVFKLGVQPTHVQEGRIAKGQHGTFSVEFMMDNKLLDFTSVPIILGGNIKNTAAAVQAWKDGGMTLENVDPQHRGTLNKIAEKYEMSASQIMTFQNLYLTTNGYLK